MTEHVVQLSLLTGRMKGQAFVTFGTYFQGRNGHL